VFLYIFSGSLTLFGAVKIPRHTDTAATQFALIAIRLPLTSSSPYLFFLRLMSGQCLLLLGHGRWSSSFLEKLAHCSALSAIFSAFWAILFYSRRILIIYQYTIATIKKSVSVPTTIITKTSVAVSI